MASQALSTVGVKFGWALGTMSQSPSAFTEIENLISIGEATQTPDTLDATPIKVDTKQYIDGQKDTGGNLQTTFNYTNEFQSDWDKIRAAYASKTDTQVMWFCAYHPSLTKMFVYIVVPGKIPNPEMGANQVLQANVQNVLVDVPEPITAIEPQLGE